jgi:hypothetical protein
VASKNLGMTPEEQENAKESHKFMPGTLAEFEQDNERKEILSKKYIENLYESFRCFEKGNELDPMNAELSYRLAEAYYCGDGVDQNKEKSVPLYQLAAVMGHAKAQHGYSNCYRNGEGIAQDNAEALKWIRKAAEQGDMSAQYDLALAYKYGNLGMQKDAEKAAIWFRKVGAQTGRKERI